MTPRIVTIPSLVLSLCLAPLASLATPSYTWTISASSTDPLVNQPANPGVGTHTLYLWLSEVCDPFSLARAEFKIESASSWTIDEFLPEPGWSVSLKHVDASGANLVLGTSCSVTAGRVGRLVVTADGTPGALDLTVTDPLPGFSARATFDDCSLSPLPPAEWPLDVRFIGYATSDGGANQDCGNGCSGSGIDCSQAVAAPHDVASGSWGRVKSEYR